MPTSPASTWDVYIDTAFATRPDRREQAASIATSNYQKAATEDLQRLLLRFQGACGGV